jgi:hypothetical protein
MKTSTKKTPLKSSSVAGFGVDEENALYAMVANQTKGIVIWEANYRRKCIYEGIVVAG